MNTSSNTQRKSLEFSARSIFFKYLLTAFYPLALYLIFFISISHEAFHRDYYIASFIIFIILSLFSYRTFSQLFPLVIKGALWKISIKNNILDYYDPILDKNFQVEISQIKYVHKNPSESAITIATNEQRIEIDIPLNSIQIEIQTLLEDSSVPSIFKQRIEKKYLVNKELKEQSRFYYRKSTFFSLLASIIGILFLSIFTINMISFVQNPFFADNHFSFALFFFMPFYFMTKQIETFFKLLNGGFWEIVLIDSKLIWNTPKSIEGSFVLNLSNIAYVKCKRVDDGESGYSYHYHIKLHSGERIDLDDSSGVPLSELAPLLGDFRKNF